MPLDINFSEKVSFPKLIDVFKYIKTPDNIPIDYKTGELTIDVTGPESGIFDRKRLTIFVIQPIMPLHTRLFVMTLRLIYEDQTPIEKINQ